MGKIIELTGIINKPLLLHLVGCLYYLHFIIYFLRLAKESQFIPLQNVVYFILLPFLVHKIFTFYINDVLIFKCPFPGPKDQLKSRLVESLRWFNSLFHQGAVLGVRTTLAGHCWLEDKRMACCNVSTANTTSHTNCVTLDTIHRFALRSSR